MRVLIPLILFFAQSFCAAGNDMSMHMSENKSIAQYFPAGISFYADYTSLNINEVYSVGSAAAVYTASRSASTPSTYVDASGVVQVVTVSNVPLFRGGYYDATGFHAQKGLQVFGASTNLIKQGIFATDTNSDGLADNWTLSENVAAAVTVQRDVETLTNISESRAQRFIHTNSGDAGKVVGMVSDLTSAGSFSQNDYVTISAFIKGTLTGCTLIFRALENDNAGVDGTNHASNDLSGSISSTYWTRVSYTVQLTDADLDRIEVLIRAESIDDGDVVDLSIALVNVEKKSYATPPIPTTTAALTRNAEVLKYNIQNNLTANSQTIIIQFAPAALKTNNNLWLYGTDTKLQAFTFGKSNGKTAFFPNLTDSSGSNSADSTVDAVNTSVIWVAVANGPLASPNAVLYRNGVLIADEDGGADVNYTVPAWGTSFYVGSSNVPDKQLDGIIQRVAIFNRALSANEIKSVTTMLQNM